MLCVFTNNLKYLKVKAPNQFFFFMEFVQCFMLKNFLNNFTFSYFSSFNINTKLQALIKSFELFKLRHQRFNSYNKNAFFGFKTLTSYLSNHSFFFKSNTYLTRNIIVKDKIFSLQFHDTNVSLKPKISPLVTKGKTLPLLINFIRDTPGFETSQHALSKAKKLQKWKKRKVSSFQSYPKIALYKFFSKLTNLNDKNKNYLSFIDIIKILNFSKTYLTYFRVTILLFKKLFRLYRQNRNAKFSKFIIALRDIFHRNIIVSRSNFNFGNFEILIQDQKAASNSSLSFPINFFNLIKPLRTFLRKRRKPVKSLPTPKNFFFKFNKKKIKIATLPTNTLFSFFFSVNFFKFLTFYLIKSTNSTFSLILDKFNLFQKQFSFYTNCHFFFNTNFNKSTSFKFLLKKKIMKVLSYQKFNHVTSVWHDNALTKFIEHCSGKKALVRFYLFIENTLTAGEYARCSLWSHRLQNFQRTIGTGFFLTESIQIIYIAIKLKDPHFLINWMRQTFQKISFWKYRMFFHYLKYLFKYFFSSIFSELKVKGLKFKLKGKVSVAGNSRTRTVVYQIGHVSHSTYDNKILHSFDLVRTFTGVIGLQIWMVF